ARRVARHRRVAEAIDAVHAGRLDDYLPALAHHWARASAPAAETARAVDCAVRAGDRALAQFANDEALVYYRQALQLLEVAQGPPDEVRRCELLISLGEAQRRAGDAMYRNTLLRAARLAQELDYPDALARAALANHRGYFSVVERIDRDRIAVLEAALDVCGRADSSLRARLLVTLAAELTFTPERDRRHRLADEAIAMARRLGE